MAYDYDVCVIGLGSAGTAVSTLAAEMGLRVLGIEKRSLGGDSLCAGSVPRRALLRTAHLRHAVSRFPEFALADTVLPEPVRPFARVVERLQFIDEQKTRAQFAKVDLKLCEGPGSFVDAHTVEVAGRRYTAKRVFICTGTRPAVPQVPGLSRVTYRTSETVFGLGAVPESLIVLGGGAVGCEMAQAFRRLGSRVSVVHMDEHLLPEGDWDAGRFLEDVFAAEGIDVHNGRRISEVSEANVGVVVRTNANETLRAAELLVAAGRRFDPADLHLENAGVAYDEHGIRVDGTLRTTQPHIFAPGDANGTYLLPHAAMHQGMVALVNSMLPRPFRRNFRRYVVPWAVFTEPEMAHVGWLERDLKANDVEYETIETKYEDYGAAIAEGNAAGAVRAYVSPAGRIYGARIIGQGASEMINEWGLAIQSGLRIHKIMVLQHAFPSMSCLSQRVAEGWMANRMTTPRARKLLRFLS